MSFPLFNDLVDHKLRDLSWSELRVLLVFIKHSDEEGIAWPGPELITKKTGIERRYVMKMISQLQKRGYLEVVQAGGGNGNVTKRRVVLSKTVVMATSVSETQTVVNPPQQTVAIEIANNGKNEPQTVVAITTRTNQGTNQKEQTTTTTPDDGSSGGGNTVVSLLVEFGLTPGSANQFAYHTETHVRKCIDHVQHLVDSGKVIQNRRAYLMAVLKSRPEDLVLADAQDIEKARWAQMSRQDRIRATNKAKIEQVMQKMKVEGEH